MGRTTTWLALILLVLAILIHLVLPFWALRWAQIPFPGFFVEQTLVVNDTHGSDWPSENSPTPFSRIRGVDGQPVDSMTTFLALLQNQTFGDQIELSLETQDNSTLSTARVQLRDFPQQDSVMMFWIPYLVGILFLAMGTRVFWIRREQAAGRIFASFCALVALSISLVFDLWTGKHLVRVWVLILPLSAATIASLALVFPQRARLVERWPHLPWLLLIPALALAVWSESALYDQNNPWAYVTTWKASYQFVAAGLIFFLGMTIYLRIWAESPLAREQSKVILLGFVLGVAPFTIWAMGTSFVRIPSDFNILYALPMVFFPLSIAYAIIRYRLLDMDRIVRQGIVYLLLTGLVALLTVVLMNVTGFLLGSAISPSSPIAIAILTTSLVVLFNPLRRHLQTLVDRAFYRRESDYQQQIQQFGHVLASTVDVDGVASAIFAAVSRTLYPQSQLIYLFDRASDAYLPIQGDLES